MIRAYLIRLFELRFGPLRGSAAYTDAADRRHAIARGGDPARQIGNAHFEISGAGIHHHITKSGRIGGCRRFAGYHDHLTACGRSEQRLHHYAADLPSTAYDDHAILWIHEPPAACCSPPLSAKYIPLRCQHRYK
jgi:hypothetical protein